MPNQKNQMDGVLPSCGNCTSSAASCVISTKLRRKTKIRGFQSDSEVQVQRLQAENAALARKLHREEENSLSLQRRLDEILLEKKLLDQSTIPIDRPLNSASIDTQVGRDKPSPVIKHMGRLVYDEDGTERFAGSTTGVHFILSVQQALHSRGIIDVKFPENCFRLHLLQHVEQHLLQQLGMALRFEAGGIFECLRTTICRPLDHYTQQIVMFNDKWAGIYPVIARSDLINSTAAILNSLERTTLPTLESLPSVFQLVMILLINSLCDLGNTMTSNERQSYLHVANMLLPRLVASADIPSIQGLILLALYIQISGQVLSMPQINGLLVQTAQMSGLHRHSRRFKFKAGQVEIRKRMWWCIYIFDKTTAFTHGLPQLIQDGDIDVDYPLDCDLEEVNVNHLSFPLPGETTPVKDFIALVHLSLIFAAILEQLYTTTKRRHGGDKIVKLHDRLQAWRQRFNASATDFEGHSATATVWLSFMHQFALMMIHRPGLTFDENEPQFRNSLERCYKASIEIVYLASSHLGRTNILGIAPLGPSVLFQCALMYIYYHYLRVPSLQEGTQDPRLDTIETAQNLLLNYRPSYRANESSQTDGSGQTWSTAMLEVKQLLQSLSLTLPSGLPDFQFGTSMPTPALSLGPLDRQSSPSVQLGLGSLDSLNQLDYLDWILDAPFDPMVGMEESHGV